MAVNRYYSSNAVDTTLVTGVDASATEIVLASTSGMPQSYPFTLALDYDTASEELVNVVGVGSLANSYKVGVVVGTASVTGRGVDGNTATAHAAGAPVKHVISARDIREAQTHIDASTKYTVTNGAVTYDVNLHGIGADEGSVVGTAKTQTLTNKSISGNANTITDIPNTSVTGTAVTLAGTQTLTNKTLNLPKINENVAVTALATELNYVSGVTSAVQTQLDAKASSSTLTTHTSAITSVHGIADTSKLAKVASASAGRTIFVQSAQPTALAVGDIWFQVTGL